MFHAPCVVLWKGAKRVGLTLALPRLGAILRASKRVRFILKILGLRRVRRMQELLSSYYPILIFMGLSALITLALIFVPMLVAPSSPDPEKNAPYECGFEAFDDARMKFDVKFYLVAILFIIFDLEVAFLFPWAVAFGDVGVFGFWSMMFFLAVLTVGFAYEWRKGALDWD